MRLLLRCLLASALFFPIVLPAQTTIHVPADKPTIQAGIDAAVAGDTVLVAPGTYFENIDFKGKAITVTSSDGAAKTVIDGGGKGHAVRFGTGESRAAILSNMTITHGGLTAYLNNPGSHTGSGIYIVNSRPTLLNNIITANYCQNVFSWNSGPLIQGNTISESATWRQCSVAETGGVYLWNDYQKQVGLPPYDTTVAMVVGNTIENNTTGGQGDGGGDGGAGIQISGGSPVIVGNIIRNNTTHTGQGGGVLFNYGQHAAVVQNLIYGNTAGCGGGGLSGGQESLIANNTIVDNTRLGGGGGYSNCEKSAQLFEITRSTYVNNIISGNTSDPTYECNDLFIFTNYQQKTSEALQAILDHNLFWNAGGPALGSTCVDVSQRYGNLVGDPHFTNAAAGDFHLAADSPAVDTGNGSVLATLKNVNGLSLDKDFDGNLREADSTGKGYRAIDMGAYELAGSTSGLPPTRIVMSLPVTDFFTGKTTPFTATLSSLAGVPTGTVTFLVDDKPFTASTIAGGVATMDGLGIRPGLHSIVASYPGQGGFAPAVSVVVLYTVPPYSTQLSIAATPSPAILGQSVTVTVQASSRDPGFIPRPLQFCIDGGTATSVVPDGAGIYRYTTSMLTVGQHTFLVTYAGDLEHTNSLAQVLVQVLQGYAVNLALTSSLNPSDTGQAVTFTAHVAAQNAQNGSPAGTVTFQSASGVLGTQALDNSGAASAAVANLPAGTTTITATYAPSNNFSGASATLQQTVHGIRPLVGFSVLPATAVYGTARTALAIVSPPSARLPSPTGFVTFCYVSAGSSSTCSGPNLGRVTVAGSGYAVLTNTPNAGTNTYSCTYSGDAVYDPVDCTPVVTNTTAATSALTLAATPNPSPALTPIAVTGRLTFSGAAAPSVPLTILVDGTAGPTVTTGASGEFGGNGIVLAAGQHTLSVVYAADINHSAASASTGEMVTANPTATALSVSPGSVIQGNTTTVAVTVNALAGTASPNGTVAVFDGTMLMGQTVLAAPVLGKTVTTVSLTGTFNTPGDHLLSARYTPADGNFVSSGSVTVTLHVSARNFTVGLDPASLTVQTEHHKVVTVTLTSIGGLTGRIGLACGTLPQVASCTWAQTTVSLPANGTVSTQMLLDTDAVPEFKSAVEGKRKGGVGLVLAGVCPLAMLLLRNRRSAARLSVLVLSITVALLQGCSGRYPAHTPPGTYAIPIVATSLDTAAPQRTVTLTLTVTP